MTAVSLKSQILKAYLKPKLHRDYENLDENSFDNDIESKSDSTKNPDYSSFEDILYIRYVRLDILLDNLDIFSLTF